MAGDLTALCAAVFGASLLGSLHCAGMCGGLVAFASGAATGRDGPGGAARAAAYHGGRWIAYVALGILAGTLGAFLDRGGLLLGVQRAAAVAAGLIVAVWGGHALATALGARIPQPRAPGSLRRAMGRGFERFARLPALPRAGGVGLLSALLPCGWLWAYVAVAAGTGDSWSGAAVMTLFWAGTVPALLAVGAAARIASGRFRKIAPALCATVLVVLGLTTVVVRLGAAADPVPGESSCHVDR